jgi:DNA repair protein RecN (Recombination protein N)
LAEHFEPLQNRLESTYHELKDIAKEIENESHKVEFDKDRQEEIQERLGLIYQLFQKHHTNSEQGLIEIREELSRKVDKVLNMDDELQGLKNQYDQLQDQLSAAGRKLSESRKSVLNHFKKELESLLKDLAMPHATINIDHSLINPSDNGIDKISILFSANAGIAPDELKNVASGGEFSRLMFCIKYILAGKTSLPTIIFDEIDTGISGEIALKLVKMMKKMSTRHQVVAITHLPQIAASGDAHYFVYKENDGQRSVSKIKRLANAEREVEIAKMIAGENPTSIAMENARELLRI